MYLVASLFLLGQLVQPSSSRVALTSQGYPRQGSGYLIYLYRPTVRYLGTGRCQLPLADCPIYPDTPHPQALVPDAAGRTGAAMPQKGALAQDGPRKGRQDKGR
ncbi:hypothetical protein VTK73DRAFT_4695 [Phialemonium thermophilum]|uniref:Secreted protein n=1 Tax=Phialemonium thermophilum TaxID=223376 RepID=A0ABR3V6Q6_9PEZI